MKHHGRTFAILAAILIVLDQATKTAVRVWMPFPPGTRRRPKIEVIEGFFNLVHAKNPGAAWGLLGTHEYRMVFFTVVTLLAVGLIIFYFRMLRPDDRLMAVSLSCVFAGAIGNFIDRLLYREVTDFLQFYLSGAPGRWVADLLGSRYWPSFNVADICINLGVGLFLWHVLVIERKRALEEAANPGAGESQDGEA